MLCGPGFARSAAMVSVFLFVPNLIVYARILLVIVGFAAASRDYRVTVASYLISRLLLDVADGLAARAFNQRSTFGTILDMVTDCASTTCLCVVMAPLYPEHVLFLVLLVGLDLFSHWFHMSTSLLLGLDSHKECTNALLRCYYWKPVLYLTVSGTELWYMSLFVLKHTNGPLVPGLGVSLVPGLYYLCLPIWAFKQVVNVVQFAVACLVLVEHDEKRRAKTAGPAPASATSERRTPPRRRVCFAFQTS